MRELIVDNFAGGGGASTGIEAAIGRSVDIAINHDQNALDMHSANHPDTLHYRESVYDVNPVAATAGMKVGCVWLSPDCRHFSKAKGSTPVKKEIRGLAWVTLRWGLDTRARVMFLENVEEFKTWGPLLACEARPDPERAGETFKAFVGMLSTGVCADHPALDEACELLKIDRHGTEAQRLTEGLGYTVEYRELRACDYGAPTIRKRFFMVMRCDGKAIKWPEATHGDPKSTAVRIGQLKPWRTAAECIDWSIPCPSIFGRKKPLADNTMRRIARGIERFVINNPSPFIVKCNHTSNKTSYDTFRGQGLDTPLQTITRKHGYAIAAPVIARQFGSSIGHPVDQPSGTVTAGGGGKSQLVAANLVKHYGGNYTGAGVGMKEPIHSVTTVDHHALVTSSIIKMRGTNTGQPTDSPLQTVTAGGLHFGEVQTHLAVQDYDESLALQVAEFLHQYGLSEFVQIDGVTYRIVDIGMRMLQPKELYAAQGFPSWYIIDRDLRGNKYSKEKQVARCGNAVPPPFAEALVRANLPEMCVQKEGVAA